MSFIDELRESITHKNPGDMIGGLIDRLRDSTKGEVHGYIPFKGDVNLSPNDYERGNSPILMPDAFSESEVYGSRLLDRAEEIYSQEFPNGWTVRRYDVSRDLGEKDENGNRKFQMIGSVDIVRDEDGNPAKIYTPLKEIDLSDMSKEEAEEIYKKVIDSYNNENFMMHPWKLYKYKSGPDRIGS